MKKKCNLLWALLLALPLIALPGMAGAETTWWGGGDGSWSDPNWNAHLPEEGDEAIIGGDGNSSFIVLDVDTPVLSGLRIESGDAVSVLHQSSNTMRIGTGGGLLIFNQSTYTLAGGTLELGEATGLILEGYSDVDKATFNLSGSGVLIKKSYEVKIGANSDTYGHFYQDGGSFRLNGAMYVGDWGNGRYTMLDGEITGYYGTLDDSDPNNDDPHMHYGGIVLGEWGGTGVFNQAGGMVTINDLSLARQTGSTGEYYLGNASLEVLDTAKIGEKGIGIFNQSSGVHSVGGELIVAQYEGSRGRYMLSGDGELYADRVIVGDEGGTGTFTQSGNSTLSVNELYISSGSESGGGNPGNGTFVMEGGTLNAGAIFNNGFFTGVAGFGNITVANGFYNAGIVAPGQSPGTLTIDGDYIQDPVGTLLIELGGYVPGVDSDFLEITGLAFLDGRLEVSLWNGFTPADGDEFDILQAGEIFGQFDFNNLSFPKGWSWQIAYLDLDGNDTYDTVRLTANSVPVPAAVWLFASGLIGLAGFRRRKQKEFH